MYVQVTRSIPPPAAKKQVNFLNSYLQFISIAKTCIYMNYNMMNTNYKVPMSEKLRQH